MAGAGQAAENQHYVPKLILRNFLSNEAKEQVSVFSKKKRTGFTTSIKNVMAERRFNEFRIDEKYLASFEDTASDIESKIAPIYTEVVQSGTIQAEPLKKAGLAVFIAFQFVRTRAFRDQFENLEKALAQKLGNLGSSIEDIQDYVPLTEDELKKQHLVFIKDSLEDFAKIIATKDMFLLKAAEGRSFYLSDNPVTFHNSKPPKGPYGSYGLSVEGIEIYCPISSDLCLAAWCPSILEGFRHSVSENKRRMAQLTLSPRPLSKMGLQALEDLKHLTKRFDSYLQNHALGKTIELDLENMDFMNSLQVSFAREFLICKQSDFVLANKFIEQNGSDSGSWISLG